jgi:hypothetical protein
MDPIKLTLFLRDYGAFAFLAVSLLANLYQERHRVKLRQELNSEMTARRVDMVSELEKRAIIEARFADTLAGIAANARAQLENSTRLTEYIAGGRR